MRSIVICFEGLGCFSKTAVAGAVVITAGADGPAKISPEVEVETDDDVEAETSAGVDAAC